MSLQLCHDKWFFGYQEPAIIRIWGSNKMYELEELLAESEPVENAEWKEYVFDLIPSAAHKYLIIQAYFSDENASPASGHVLVDLAKLNKL